VGILEIAFVGEHRIEYIGRGVGEYASVPEAIKRLDELSLILGDKVRHAFEVLYVEVARVGLE
jgi:hypothetical protein